MIGRGSVQHLVAINPIRTSHLVSGHGSAAISLSTRTDLRARAARCLFLSLATSTSSGAIDKVIIVRGRGYYLAICQRIGAYRAFLAAIIISITVNSKTTGNNVTHC